MNKFYIYAHTKTTDNSVFYIGRGTGKRKISTCNRNRYWVNVVNKHGFFAEIIEDNLTSDEANEREIYWIEQFKKDGAILVNLTLGGGGLSGRSRTEDEKRRISEALTGKPFSEERKSKMIGNKNAIGMKHTDEAKAKVSAAQKGKPKSEEHRRKLSEALKGKPLTYVREKRIQNVG